VFNAATGHLQSQETSKQDDGGRTIHANYSLPKGIVFLQQKI
jgi:hypothetical protein